jgi:hypothetical protein
MNRKIVFFYLFCITTCIFAETQYFDALFGINSIEKTETLEGIKTETHFTLTAQGNIINIIKKELPEGKTMFFLSCSEKSNNYYPVKTRISIDGNIREFNDDSPNYGANYNWAIWSLSEEFVNLLRACTNLAIEFGGKVYRFGEQDLIIDFYGDKTTIENPLGKLKDFLQ